MAKWTPDITYKFVEEYLKHECLYISKHPNYKFKGSREKALLEVSKAMNIPGFGCKEVYTKMRNLRSTYSQEVKKIKLSTISGTDDVYTPQIPWFKLLDDALNGVNVCSRDSQSNMETDSEYAVILKFENPTDQEDEYVEENGPITSPESPSNYDPIEHKQSPIPLKRTKREHSLDIEKNVDTGIPSTSGYTETEFDIFGRNVAAQLKTMPIHLALQAEMYIHNYLCNLRLEHMGHKTSN